MPVAEYPKLPSPELRLWLSNLRQAVMGASDTCQEHVRRRLWYEKHAWNHTVGFQNAA